MSADHGSSLPRRRKSEQTRMKRAPLHSWQRCLIVSGHSSSARAFEDLGMMTARLRPQELLGGLEFDRRSDDQMLPNMIHIVWIDLQAPITFGGSLRHATPSHLVDHCAPPGCADMSQATAWTRQVVELCERCELHVAKHLWCAMDTQAKRSAHSSHRKLPRACWLGRLRDQSDHRGRPDL